jgi:Ca-activated chloride channel family protein
MTFVWPPLLLLLLVIPVGAWAYRSRERRREERVARFGRAGGGGGGAGSAGWAPYPVGRWTRWARRIPAVLTLAGLTILVFSLARPQAVLGVPRLEGTVMLAFDVSGSMAATDVAPTRMEAAKSAALRFVEEQPASVRIGTVVFSDSGFSTQVPTPDRVAVASAIQRLGPERGTSLGRGILAALSVIEADADPTTTDYYTNDSAPPEPAATPVPPGVYEPAIIVLITDGENTVQPDPLEAARAARDRGVRIHTVGIGTAAGVTLEVEGFLVHTALDEAMLQGIATLTDGTYRAAADEADLTALYDDVGRQLVVRSEPFELTPVLAAAGFVLLVAGGLVSLRWFGRVP